MVKINLLHGWVDNKEEVSPEDCEGALGLDTTRL